MRVERVEEGCHGLWMVQEGSGGSKGGCGELRRMHNLTWKPFTTETETLVTICGPVGQPFSIALVQAVLCCW